MSLLVTNLAESAMANVAVIRLETSMLSKVIPQVARLLEYFITTFVEALEDEILSVCFRVFVFDHLVPLVWYSLEMLLRDYVLHQRLILVQLEAKWVLHVRNNRSIAYKVQWHIQHRLRLKLIL